MIGRALAHYKILEKIGSGGMGEVYLDKDTKLDRKVALKVLPPELAENEERRARFKREAKAIAALNHPNIVTVHSVEEDDGVHFITMELVEGQTVTELLPKTGFPLSKFFDLAIPLADAVAAAHQNGITHRDLKPDNMMIGSDGRVKVLDFGLAKPAAGFVVDGASELPTEAKTEEGAIVGTLNYMSPEQAEGKPLDHRSDIFSMGIIFYETVTGQRPFRGDSATAVLSSILRETPKSVTDVNPTTPELLGRLIRRCLAKDPDRRYQAATDIRIELEELKDDLESGKTVGTLPDTAARSPWLQNLTWAIGATAGLLLLLWVGGWLGTRAEGRRSAPRLTNAIQVTSAIGVETAPTWSPDV